MIKLTCPNCNSDHIFYRDAEQEEDTFKCEECGNEFTFQEAWWESE